MLHSLALVRRSCTLGTEVLFGSRSQVTHSKPSEVDEPLTRLL